MAVGNFRFSWTVGGTTDNVTIEGVRPLNDLARIFDKDNLLVFIQIEDSVEVWQVENRNCAVKLIEFLNSEFAPVTSYRFGTMN